MTEDLQNSLSELDLADTNYDNDDFSLESKSEDESSERYFEESERFRKLEEEQELLNSSLIALTTHFAQVQFRLKQIVDAPAGKKEELLKELEEFAFRGIPDIQTNLQLTIGTSSLSSPTHENATCNTINRETDLKIEIQKNRQKDLICQLKSQLEDLEQYAYETGIADLPQSIILERQNMIINHLREKLNFNFPDYSKLSPDDLKWQVDCAINQIVNPLKMKEQLINQLKTQINDLERFIHYLQGEVSAESLACTCACPVHAQNSHSKRMHTKPSRDVKSNHSHLGTIQKILELIHLYIFSQISCTDQKSSYWKKNAGHSWRELRTRLDISVEHILEILAENECSNKSNISTDLAYNSDSDSLVSHYDIKLTAAIRKHLAINIRDLLQHGCVEETNSNSVVPFVACFVQRNHGKSNSMHPWEVILKYYEIKNGQYYISSPAQKLSQSFNLDLQGRRNISTKQNLLITIGNIIAMHSPYKRSFDSNFKAFVCAALNKNMLVGWLKLILQCQYILENHYTSWSYVVKTGFQDAFHTLDKLTKHKFDLPVDLAVQQFQNIKEVF